MVHAAFDAGINFFFLTADMHWPLYEPVRSGLTDLIRRGRGMRDDIVVAACCYVTQPEFCYTPFEEVLEAVPGLKRIDVLVAGGAYADELGRRLPVFLEHRDQGFVGTGAVGASFHDIVAARRSIIAEETDVAFVRYNPGHRGAAIDLFPYLSRPRGTVVYNFNSTHGHVNEWQWRSLGLEDYWQPGITDYYRFALSEPQLDGILCAPESEPELGALIDALEKGPLTHGEREHLAHLADLSRGNVALRRR